MECGDFRKGLIRSQALSPKERAALRRHLASCPRCQEDGDGEGDSANAIRTMLGEIRDHRKAAKRRPPPPDWFDRLVNWLADTDLGTRTILTLAVAVVIVGLTIPLSRLGPPGGGDSLITPTPWTLESGRMTILPGQEQILPARRLPGFVRLAVVGSAVVQRVDGMQAVLWPGAVVTITGEGAEMRGRGIFAGINGLLPFCLTVDGGTIRTPVTGMTFSLLASSTFTLVELKSGTLSVVGSGISRSLSAGFSALLRPREAPRVFPTIEPILRSGMEGADPSLERVEAAMRTALAPDAAQVPPRLPEGRATPPAAPPEAPGPEPAMAGDLPAPPESSRMTPGAPPEFSGTATDPGMVDSEMASSTEWALDPIEGADEGSETVIIAEEELDPGSTGEVATASPDSPDPTGNPGP